MVWPFYRTPVHLNILHQLWSDRNANELWRFLYSYELIYTLVSMEKRLSFLAWIWWDESTFVWMWSSNCYLDVEMPHQNDNDERATMDCAIIRSYQPEIDLQRKSMRIFPVKMINNLNLLKFQVVSINPKV